MTDIVGTFRSYALDKDNLPRMASEVIPIRVGLLLDAASTIETLRAEVERLKDAALFNDISVLPEKDAEYAALRAEVERLKVENEAVLSANRDVMLHWDVLKADYEKLRAALKEIAGYRMKGRSDADIARTALEEKYDR